MNTTTDAEVAPSDPAAERLYSWTTTGGEIHSNGKTATYVAPEKAGIYTITFKVCNRAVTRAKSIQVKVKDASETNKPAPTEPADTDGETQPETTAGETNPEPLTRRASLNQVELKHH